MAANNIVTGLRCGKTKVVASTAAMSTSADAIEMVTRYRVISINLCGVLIRVQGEMQGQSRPITIPAVSKVQMFC